MKQKFDFVLKDWKGMYREIFRFYPRRTRVYSPDKNPSKNWEGVYKTYYSWAIIRQYYGDEPENKIECSEILFNMPLDECSVLPVLPEKIRKAISACDRCYRNSLGSIGQPAGEWYIEKRQRYHIITKQGKTRRIPYEECQMRVFNNWTNQGYRFTLNKEDTLRFCGWLDDVNQYALEHGIGN